MSGDGEKKKKTTLDVGGIRFRLFFWGE